MRRSAIGAIEESTTSLRTFAARSLKQKNYARNSHSAVFVEVRVDADLGTIRVARVVSAIAAGRILNPKTARSQILGGVVWGIGMALGEETVIDHSYGRFMNANLGEYHVPVNADVPDIEVIFVEERDEIVNPLGVKGVGEIGIVGVAPAIANAIHHATGSTCARVADPAGCAAGIRTGPGPRRHPFCSKSSRMAGLELEQRAGITYVLPIRTASSAAVEELTGYLRWLAGRAEVIVVDGSPPEVFTNHEAAWGDFTLHVPPDPDLRTPNGKVGGVLTGLRYATHERLIVADDDVRWDEAGLTRAADLLAEYHVVRPQNFFDPLPWHARWDTGRTLLNRITGGDWPGTLAVRRSVLRATGGYRGDVLFENLELVRTVLAAGGREAVPLDLYVRRRPARPAIFGRNGCARPTTSSPGQCGWACGSPSFP